ncbi:TPA: hypothetical protein DEP30_02305 [Candidatus Nomurabacteria bacterium]|nr:MAG: hypothetical protein UR97_C0003G0031 [Candidatus Nomurabacteria bacterium GW2011_GWE2_36_115]KKP94101.1 MAG: hypothetical protein US00_C0003G0025 [Candidatus Nomurabacteria bacterium GW2011_GWF2_36_126]KKP96771.1 MAG: hypothetical protein US04_C0001G0273 [Candidatus Nomurabacteria bacterium GW2011_GWD2_36_14]KKP99625.1 MAG: hypothetical protein US08_C0001G0308 [Candidatus Nomurabacteria bacterium GW2011_GWF2_36_19]KKQ05459.1 MAG: hypothetical protein US17_C0004G0031 [Candidatus Nomuraba
MRLDSSTEEELNIQELNELSSFFDLLAKFDYEDKQKEKLELKVDSLVSAPRESTLDSNI